MNEKSLDLFKLSLNVSHRRYNMIEFPKQIKTYKIFGKLGAGGYGQVFVGRDINTLQNY